MGGMVILIDLVIAPESVERLRRLPGATVHVLDRSSAPQPRPPELLGQADVLLCKYPPLNFDDLTSLKLWQLATVGYDHLAHLKLGERPFAVCNARGLFDTGIAEWNVAMMINLTRDLRGMIRNQDRGHWDPAAAFQQELR